MIERIETCLIVTMNRVGLIGTGNRMPWALPTDLARFKAITMACGQVIMGRKTWMSIGGNLPDRATRVVSRQMHVADRAVVDAVAACVPAVGVGRAVIVGGAGVFREALNNRQAINLRTFHLTVVEQHHACEFDTHFPGVTCESDLPLYDKTWKVVECVPVCQLETDDLPYVYYRMESTLPRLTSD